VLISAVMSKTKTMNCTIGFKSRFPEPSIFRGEKMSTRNFDHCECGHIRQEHEDFERRCKQCNCVIFHRSMRMNTD